MGTKVFNKFYVHNLQALSNVHFRIYYLKNQNFGSIPSGNGNIK